MKKRYDKLAFSMSIAIGAATLVGVGSGSAVASTTFRGVASIASVRQGQNIVHICETAEYETCTLTIGVVDSNTTIKSDGKVVIGSARNNLNVEADFVQIASMGGYSELSGTNGVWIQSDLGVFSKVESTSGNITVDGNANISFITALQGRATVNGDLTDAARTGEMVITAQEIVVTGDYNPEYTTLLELAN